MVGYILSMSRKISVVLIKERALTPYRRMNWTAKVGRQVGKPTLSANATMGGGYTYRIFLVFIVIDSLLGRTSTG